MRVLVTGSRDWPEPDVIESALGKMLGTPHLTLVHGGCPNGADEIAHQWAKKRQREGHPIEIEIHYPLWNTHGRSAGMIRNAEMVKQNANICLAFIHNDSKGSTYTKELAEKHFIPTETYRSYSVAGRIKDVVLEDVRIVFRNFRGEEGQYNRKGDRNFAVVLTDEQADELEESGWNVKRKPPKEEGDDNFNYLSVSVSFKGRPPRMVLISSVPDGKGSMVKTRTQLDEDLCEMLDYVDAETIDLILNPYEWHVSGKTGVKAYLNAIYVTLNQDALTLKYAHVPEMNQQKALEGSRKQLALTAGSSDDDIEDAEVVDDPQEDYTG